MASREPTRTGRRGLLTPGAGRGRPADAPPVGAVDHPPVAGHPVAPRSGRLPVPPLLQDLAGWTWRLLLLAALGWLLLQIATRLELITLPFAAAVLVNALLSPVTTALRSRGVPRGVATLLIVVPGLALVGGVISWVVDEAVAQTPALAAQLSDTVSRLPVPSSTLMHWRDQLVQEISSHRAVLTQSALSGLVTGAQLLTGLVLTVLLTLILLTDGDRMWSWVVGRFPASARVVVDEAGQHAFWRLSGWIRGTVIIAIFHSVVTAITLLVLGVPLVAPLAVIVFIGSFVPLVGAVIFGGLAVVVAFASGGLTPAIVMVAVLLVDNQIESHVLQPFLVGRYVRLHPFVIAVVITVGAVLAGLPGTLLAVPITAAAHAALQRIELPPRRRPRAGPS